MKMAKASKEDMEMALKLCRRNATRYMFLRCMSAREYANLVSFVLQSGVGFDETIDDMIEAKLKGKNT